MATKTRAPRNSLEVFLDLNQIMNQNDGCLPIHSHNFRECLMHRSAVMILVFLSLAAFAPSANAASPAGSWRGTWSSQTTGHRGPMRARIRPIAPDTYRAIFVGRFAGVIPFGYPATLKRVAGTSNRYTSSQRLPLLGTYRMTASVTTGRFYATFQGKKDRSWCLFSWRRCPDA